MASTTVLLCLTSRILLRLLFGCFPGGVLIWSKVIILNVSLAVYVLLDSCLLTRPAVMGFSISNLNDDLVLGKVDL